MLTRHPPRGGFRDRNPEVPRTSRALPGQLVDYFCYLRVLSLFMKSSVKKSAAASAAKKTLRPAVAPKPLLNVVPLDEVKRLLEETVDEVRKLADVAAHPPVTVPKPENVGPSTSSSVSTDIKPILLSDSHRVALESLFGGEPLSKPDDVVRFSHRLSTVKLNGPDGEEAFVTIPLDTLERLEARRPVDTTLKEMVERGFADYLEGLINGVF